MTRIRSLVKVDADATARHYSSTPVTTPKSSWRPLAPLIVLFALLLVFAVGGMWVIAREADRSDAARAREAVSRTFQGVLVRLEGAVEMNAAAPPIASALSGPGATQASAYGYLNFTSSDALGYYGTVVLNSDGSAFAGTRAGKPWSGPDLAIAARLIAPVADRLPAFGAGTVHATVRDATGQALAVAVTNVLPNARDARGKRKTDPLRRLAMVAPIVVQVIPKMLPSLGVEDFSVATVANPEDTLSVAVERGLPVIFAWRSRNPGHAAMARWAPAIGTLLSIALIMVALAGRANMRAIRALEQLAHHDSLTGLANRLAFRKEIDSRQARGEPLVLGMLDLNGFKAVNDQHGHLVGDELLQAVAYQFAQSARPSDFVARLGGDEFAWVSPSPEAASRLVDDFTERLCHPLAVGQLHLRIGAATGIALARPGITPSALMAAADVKLYENKSASKQRFEGYCQTSQVLVPLPSICASGAEQIIRHVANAGHLGDLKRLLPG